jgi:exonuclease III
LISSKGVSSSHRIKNCLRDSSSKRKYDILFNSSSNSRGVAVLINCNIDTFTMSFEHRDINENFLILECSIDGLDYAIGAIYGPNNTSRAFYQDLASVIRTVKSKGIENIILGGDWNATWDRSTVTSNIDTFQMAGLPNAKYSEYLENMANEFSLGDPFRILYPEKRDFTYSPFGNVQLNRSRLDFYVMSANLVPHLTECFISAVPKCKLFDHKNVTLYLFQQTPKIFFKQDVISNTFLKEHALKYSVEIASRRAHLLSLNQQSQDTPANYRNVQDFFNIEMEKINGCLNELKLFTKSLEKISTVAPSDLDLMGSAASDQRVKMLLDEMAPISILESLEKRCSHRDFFIALVNEIRAQGSKTQRILSRNKKIKIENLAEKLKALKLDYINNSNEIFELENKLRIIIDCDLRERARDIKLLECLQAEKATPHCGTNAELYLRGVCSLWAENTLLS